MAATTSTRPAEAHRVRRLAVVRLLFGQLQMAGAVATLLLLVQTGTSVPTAAVCFVTGLVTLASMVLFRRQPK